MELAIILAVIAAVGIWFTTHHMISSPAGEKYREQASAIELSNGNSPKPTPSGFQKPDKNYCGQDIPRYFALFLLDQAVATLAYPNLKAGDFSIHPVEQDLKVKIAERDSIGNSLNTKGCDKLFMTYKNVRDSIFGEGELTNWVVTNLNLNMSTEEAFQIILRMVSGWW